jgi:hypothetical protein
MGERQRAVADVDVVERIAHPCGFDLAALNSGVGQRLLERVDHEIFRTLVPAFAERRAAHADDGDLVSDAAGHRFSFRSAGAAWALPSRSRF